MATGVGPPGTPGLEVLPKHFLLHPGEQIHYQVLERSQNGQPRSVDYEFDIRNPQIVRPIEPKGVIEAVAPGHTELVVRTPTSARRITIEVAGRAQPPMMAIPHNAIRKIMAKDLLFVGHANRDGFDHTAVAKSGIDRLVQEAKKSGWPVVYFVSKEYPNWYTADWHPDTPSLARHKTMKSKSTPSVVFTGGSLMFCTLRNAQMTLHGHGEAQ